MYSGSAGSVTPGHILPYPLHIRPDGQLRCLEGFEFFPDFPAGSKIIGKESLLEKIPFKNIPMRKITT